VRETRQRGFSLVELIVTVAIMGILIFMLVALQRELVTFDRKLKVDLFSQPNTSSVLHRIRRDVLNAQRYHPEEPYADYEWSETTMLLDYPLDRAEGATKSFVVVWDFTEPDLAKRIELVDEKVVSEWSTTSGARYELNYDYRICRPTEPLPSCGGPQFIRLLGYDSKGGLVVDEKVAPALLR
jgi:prepilin-type N-terminal cleavage/methylation domain-containing protein